MSPTPAYPLSVALQRVNSALPEVRKLTRYSLRQMAERGEVATFRTAGGHLRFTSTAIQSAMLKLSGPSISLDDFTSFTGACEADEHIVVRAHKLGAEMAIKPTRSKQLQAERNAILEDIRARSIAAAAEGRHELAWSLRCRASALQASTYTVIDGVVHVTAAGAIAPNMPTEIVPDGKAYRDGA